MEQVHPLKAFREQHDPPLSQEQLAKLLRVDRVTVNRWESGRRRIEVGFVLLISHKTGIAATKLRPDLAKLFASQERGKARPRVRRRVA